MRLVSFPVPFGKKRHKPEKGDNLRRDLPQLESTAIQTLCAFQLVLLTQIAFSPISSVRIRIASSMLETKIFPSPTEPVFAALIIALTAASTRVSATIAKTIIFGTKSTVYSLPRYISV